MVDAFVSYTEANGEEKERGGASPCGNEEQEIDAGTAEGDSSEGSTDTLGGQGFVYFIETEDGRFIKIGFSKQPMMRLAQLGTLMPVGLIGYFPGSRATEKWLHTKFAAGHRVGEWFENTDALREFIAILGLIQPLQEKRRKIKAEEVQPIEEPEPEAEEIEDKNPAAVSLGRKGGKKSAAGRMAKMTPEERSEVARIAAAASAKVRAKKAAAKKAAKKK